jgi:hypothetical protein
MKDFKSDRYKGWEKMRTQLVEAMKGCEPTCPVIVSARFYAEMRFWCSGGDEGRFEIIVYADLIKKGFMAVWNGRPVFIKRKGDPEPYPEGSEIAKGERR